MNKTRVLTVVAALTVAVMFYALIGFFLVPVLIKKRLTAHVEHQLKHKLALGDVRFNPFTFGLEAIDLDLREAGGGALLSFKRLYVNFEGISVFQRTWDFAEVTLEAPLIYGELRTDGSNNFTALLARLSDPQAKPDAPPPPIKIQWIRLTEGRIDLADLQAGKAARLRIAPIALELTALSTLRGEKGPYKITARTADGETLTWEGSLALYPIASTGKLVLADWQLATWARMLGTRIAVEAPSGKLQASLQYAAGYAEGKPSLEVQDLDVRLSQFAIVPKGATAPIVSGEHLALLNLTFGLDRRALSIQRAEWSKGRLAFEIDPDGRPNWATLYRAPVATSAAGEQILPPPVDASDKQATIVQSAAPPPWRVKLQEVAIGDLAMKFADRRARTEVEWQRAAIHLAVAAELSAASSILAIDGFKTAIDGIAIDHAGGRVAADQLEIATSSAKATIPSSGATEFRCDAPVASIAGLAMRQAANELSAQKLGLRVGEVSGTLPQESHNGARVQITDATLETAAIGARPAALKKDALEVRALELGTKSIVLSFGTETLDTTAEGIGGTVSDLTARGSSQDAEILRLERAQMTGGVLSSRERRLHLERMQLENVAAAAAIDAAGKLDWAAFIAGFTDAADTQSAAKPATPVWTTVVKNFEIKNLAGSFSDQRYAPPIALAVSQVSARASNIGTDPAAHAQIALTGRVKEGGELAVNGRINPHTLESDLKVKVSDLALPLLQPFLARHARLQISSALGSAEGRLRYGLRKSAGADLVFEGNAGLNRVAIEETEPRQPFLALEALRGSNLTLAIGPNRLDIPDLRVEGLNGRLFIAEDQSVNLTKVLRREPAGAPASAQPTAGQAVSASPDEFPISIARIRIDGSRLEFADLSLRPQFAARMHELKGVLTGVSTARDSRAQADLEARVDEFGAARIRGEMNMFRPRVFTAIDMNFRNLEMTSLTPYTTKFAGYRIASGKLSMDLQYRIKDSMLVGENKLVLDKLELGERVESPTAFNLPLELAIAILKDSDGKIDIGVPVSGSLDDPQFSYGALVWKAIGNLFTRIITAPFRALAGLFGGGGGSEKLEAIEFDPGRDDLLPPERQKLRTVGEALAKRPQLKLTVKPAYAEKLDRAAMQSHAVRREIALRSGIKLAPGEDPGPVDYSNPRTQRVIETLFVDRNSAAAARDVRAQQKATATSSGSDDKAALPANIARAMAQQLFDAQPVLEAELAALAKRRGDAITAALNEGGKLDSNRLDTANPGAVAGNAERSVATALELSIVK